MNKVQLKKNLFRLRRAALPYPKAETYHVSPFSSRNDQRNPSQITFRRAATIAVRIEK